MTITQTSRPKGVASRCSEKERREKDLKNVLDFETEPCENGSGSGSDVRRRHLSSRSAPGSSLNATEPSDID